MKFFYVDPEVAGDFGDETVLDTSLHPPVVSRLHYRFQGWLGDSLLETFPIFIVTEEAKRALEKIRVSGAVFDNVQVTTGDMFQELHPDLKLPPFVWLKPEGTAGQDDFGIASNLRLVISERVLDLFRRLGLAHADIDSFEN